MPGAVFDRAAGESRGCSIGAGDPVPRVARVRVTSVAVVGHGDIADEVIARQQASAIRERQQIRMIVTDTSIQIRDHHRCAASRDIPGALRVDGAQRAAVRRTDGILQIPLPSEQRIVRRGVRETTLIDLGVFDLWIGAQPRQANGYILARHGRCHFHHVQARHQKTARSQTEVHASGERRDRIGRRFADRGDGTGAMQLYDQPMRRRVACAGHRGVEMARNWIEFAAADHADRRSDQADECSEHRSLKHGQSPHANRQSCLLGGHPRPSNVPRQ